MQSTPDPVDLLLGRVDAKLNEAKRPHGAWRDFHARIPLDAVADLYRAAADREMSVAAYCRRATLAFVAFDQRLDLRELLANEPATRLNNANPRKDVSEAGEGHGLWRIGTLY